jgi:transposase-like protein
MSLESLKDAPEKLRTLAKWFDKKDHIEHKENHDVQEDIRRWAKDIEILVERGMSHGGAECPSCGGTDTVEVYATHDMNKKSPRINEMISYYCCCTCRKVFLD